MVAIVAGNRLGLLNCSLNTVGAAGVLGQSVLGHGSNRAFVNAVNGNLILQTPDAQLAGRGTDIFALRTYNSLGATNDADEDGWRWGYQQTVAFQGPGAPAQPEPSATVIRTDGDGHETSYTWDPARATFFATEGSGAYDELRYDGSAAEWVWTDGSSRVTERFSNSYAPGMTGRLLRRTDSSNNSIALSYDAGRLSVIQDTASQQELRVTYGVFNGFTRPQRLEARALADDENGHPIPMLGSPLRLAEYDYDGHGRLTSLIRYLTPGDGSTPAGPGFVTSYSYEDTSNRISMVRQSDGTSVSFAYDASGRVSAVKDNSNANESQFEFAYTVQANSTAITDGDGRVWTYRHDGTGQLIQVQSPPVGGTPLSTSLLYDAAGNVVGITGPNNNAVTYGYENRGNRALERDALGNTTTRTFSPLSQVLTETRYRIPDSDGSGSHGPADPATTRYAYDANARLRFSVSAEGRVTENRYGSTSAGYGLLTQTLLYVGQLCDVSALNPAQQLTEADLNDWIAALPDRTQVQLTEYSYDLRGNMSQQNSYATVSAAGAGVLDSRTNVEEYICDAYGQVRQQIAVRGSARDRRVVTGSLAYDGAQRVLETARANGLHTIAYDDANRRVTATTSSGVTETREYDGRGRLARVSQAAGGMTRETRYVYDNADRLRMVEDAQGGRRFRFYDAAGRLEYTVDSTGAVARFEHTPGGQLARQTRYRNPADAGSWFDSAANVVTKSNLAVGGAGSDVELDAAQDRATTFEYDAAERLTVSTDALGTVTTTTYDGLSRLIMTQTGDRVTRYLYDKDDRRLGIVDALGYLTEYKYDAGGRLGETVRYSQRNPTAANVSDPVWIGITQQNCVGGRAFEYRAPAYDADGDALTFSVVGAAPAWLAFDTETATLRGTPPATPSTESVTLRADDGRGRTSDVTVTIAVAAPAMNIGTAGAGPAWAPLSPLDIVANTPVSYVIPPASGPSLAYRAVGGLPPGLSFDANTLTLSGSCDTVGFFSLLLRAEDANGALTDRTLSLRIRPAANFAGQPVGSEQPSAWRPADDTALRSYLFYDGRGRVVGAVDEQQFLTETVCDDALGTRQTRRYLVPVTVAPDDDLASLKSRAGGWLQISLVQYDDFGRVREVGTLDGSTVTRNDYDDAGRLTRVTGAAGTGDARVRRTFYNAFGEITATLGGEGNAWLGTNPTPQRVADAIRDYGIRHEYNTLGRRVRSADANGNRTLFYHDRESRLTHTVDVVGQSADDSLAGEVGETTYNSFGETQSVRRYATPMGNAGMGELLATGGGGFAGPSLLGKLAALADASLDQVTLYDYDRDGRVVRQLDGENGFTENIYNAYGELAAQLRSTREGQTTTRQFDYDVNGRVIAQTDDAGGINANTRTEYDAFGRAVRIVNAMGQATTTAYQDSGRSITVTDPLQRATRTDYDALGRVTRVINPLGHETDHAYDDATRGVTTTTPEGRQTTTARNRHGETERVTDARGNARRYGYNLDGQQTTLIDALGRTVAQTAYDRSGRAVELTDARGTVTRLAYDQRNRVIERRLDPAGLNLITRTEFNALGRQTRVTEGAESVALRATTYDYDRKGRTKTILVDPAAGGLQLSNAYRYDGLDNTVAVTRATVSGPDRQVTLSEFDNLGRLVKEMAAPATVFGAGAPGTRDLTTRYRYDPAGRLSRRVDAIGHSTWQVYDAAGQRTHEISALGDVAQSSYDSAGRRVYSHRYLERLAPGMVADFGDVVSNLTVPAAALNDARSHVVYNADGQVRLRLHAAGAAGWAINENRHDANGNVIEVRAYDRFLPEARMVVLESPASPITLETIQQELGTTLGYHDEDSATLVGVQRTFLAHDANNRLRFTVDSSRSVVESVYDAAGNVIANVRFAVRPALADRTQAAIDVAVNRADPNNQWTRYAYDTANRLRYTVDALNSVSETGYDTRGNVVMKVRRATRPALTQYTESAIAAALTTLPSTVNDEITHFVHDAADRLRFAIDATGLVSENAHDASGNVVMATRFARRPTPTPTMLSDTTISAAVQPLRGDGENQVTRFAYDPENRLRFVVDSQGSVSESVYDGNGNVLATTRFAARPSLAQYDESAIATAVASLQPDPGNRTTRHAYDAQNRLRFSVDALGSIDERAYDGLGNVTATERFALRPPLAQYAESAIDAAVAPQRGDPDNRIEHSLYDALGRVRFSLLRVSLEAGQPRYRVTGNELNALGQVVSGTAYASAVGLAAISEAAITAATGLGAPSTDRVSRFAYDAGGREIYRLQAVTLQGDQRQYRVSAQRYDAFGQVVGTTDYALAVGLTAADPASIEAAAQAVADPARDRVGAVAYDALGQAMYSVRMLGPGSHQVTQQEHDALGRVFRTVQYANAVGPLPDFEPATLEVAVNAIAAAQDRTAQYVYDAAGRQRFELQADKDGHWTVGESRYDVFGNLVESRRYERYVTETSIAGLDAIRPAGLGEQDVIGQLASLGYDDNTPATLIGVQRARFAYDTQNRLRFTIDALGSVVENVHDALGDRTATVRYAARPVLAQFGEPTLDAGVDRNDLGNRLQHFAYDAQGQLRFEVQVIEANVGTGGKHAINERRYDALGQMVESRGYATATGHLGGYDEPTLAAVVGANTANDRVSAVAYDAGGRQAFALRELRVGQGNSYVVTQQLHDALGQRVQRIDYAATPVLAQFDYASVESALVLDFSNDRTTTYVRDAAGRLRFEIRPDRSLRESQYDALDQVTETRQFDFTLPDHQPRTEADMMVLSVGRVVGDGMTRGQLHVWDAAGRCTSTADAAGNLERHEYGALGERTRWTDKNGKVWLCVHDRRGRKRVETTPAFEFKLRGEALSTPPLDRVLETHFEHDAFGNLIRQIGAANFPGDATTTDFLFDTAGRPTGTLQNGYYDAATGTVESDPGPGRFRREASILYDALGNTGRISDRKSANAFTHTYRTYDPQGHVVHEVNALNHVTRYTYSPFGERETVTRYSIAIAGTPQNGVYWTAEEIDPQLNFGVDELGHLMLDYLARTIRLGYDKLGRKISVTLPTATYYSTQMPGDASQSNYFRPVPDFVTGVQDAAVTSYEYNAFGDLTLQRVRANTIVEWQDTSFAYDPGGRRTRHVDAAGYVTALYYDAAGNLTRLEELSGQQDGADRATEFAYDILDRQIRVDRYRLRYTDVNGVEHGVVSWTWANGGELIDPDADVATTIRTSTYDPYGKSLAVTDAAGNITAMRYNAMGKLIAVTGPAQRVAPLDANGENAVDPFLHQLTETLVTSMTLDPFGRAVWQLRATSQGGDARETLQSYDAAGNLVSTTDAEGNVRWRACDSAGRVIRETQAIGADLGPMELNQQGLERRYFYDAVGQLTDTLDVYVDGTELLQSGKTAVYNAFGEVVEERRKWGPASQSPAMLSMARVARYDYDNAGHVADKVAADRLTLYFYNLLGQVTREEKRGNSGDTDGTGKRITELQYDVLGRTTMMRRPAFDADLTQGTGTSVRLVTPYISRTLDRWGNVRGTEEGGYEFGNGQPSFAPHRIFRSYGYDSNNRVIAENLGTHGIVSASGVSTNVQISKISLRDLSGNVVKEVDEAREPQADSLLSSRARRREYDKLGRVTAEIDATDTRVEYAYSLHGERLGRRNGRGTVFFDRYDRNGNVRFHGVLRTTSPAGPGEYNSHVGTGTISRTYLNAYLYDQANRRFASKTFTDAANAPWSYTWLDGRNLGIAHCDTFGVISRTRFDAFGNKAVEIDGAGVRSEWNAATEDFVLGRIENYRLPADGGGVLKLGQYTYNDYGEVKAHTCGNTRTEYDRHKNGLVVRVKIVPDLTHPNVFEMTTYEYDARSQLTTEIRFDPHSVQTKMVSYDNQGRLARVEQSKAPTGAACDVVYAYDEWSNVRRVQASYAHAALDEPTPIVSWYDFDDAGRTTVSNGALVNGQIRPKMRTNGSASIAYDNVGRRSHSTQFLHPSSKAVGGILRKWDTMREEAYEYDDLGHLRSIQQRLRAINIVESNLSTGDGGPKPNRNGASQPLSIRSTNLRGDVTRSEQWTHVSVAPNDFNVNPVPAKLSVTTTAYRTDGQVSWTRTEATDPKKSTETQNTYDAQTGQLASYVFHAFRSDGAPFTATFEYRLTFQNGRRVVRRISDLHNGLHTIKNYDQLGRLFAERVDLQKPNGAGSDRYEQRSYDYGADGRIIFKNTELRLSSSGPGTIDLDQPTDGQQTYVYAGNRLVGTVGTHRLEGATKFDFSYTPLSESGGGGSSRYVVQSGESLLDIAQASYGDSALWYVIADANGITTTPEDPLPTTEVGKAYEVPDVVSSSHSASTFMPFGMGEIIGNDRPIAIPPPPPRKHSDIEMMAVAAVSITIQVGVTALLTYVGVPAPVSYGIAAGLSNLGGQATTWELGMREPGQDAIDWGGVGLAAFEGYAFSVAGPVAAISREVWEQGKDGFSGWTSGPGLNWTGIGGSLFNVGFDALGPTLGGPRSDSFNFSLAGLINSAYNPSSGWAIPGSGRSPVVGAFEYAYGGVANGLATMAFTWIHQRLDRPTAAAQAAGPRSVDDPKGPLPGQLLDMFDEIDGALIQELDREALTARNERTADQSNQRLHWDLKMAAIKDRIEHFGESIDDRAIITSTRRQMNAQRIRREQEAALTRARMAEKAARRKANAARAAAQPTAGPGPSFESVAREAAELDDQILKGFYSDSTYVRVSEGTSLMGLPLENRSGIYDSTGAFTTKNAELDQIVGMYRSMAAGLPGKLPMFIGNELIFVEGHAPNEPMLIGNEVIIIHDLATPAEMSGRLGLSDVMNFQEYSRVYKFQKHTTVGVEREYLNYQDTKSKRILTNWRDIDRAKGAVDLISVTMLTAPLAGFDPLLIFGPMVVGTGAEAVARWAGYDDVFASGVGNLAAIGSSFFMPSVRSLGLAPSPSRISSYLTAERAARWEQNAARLEANGLEWEMSHGIQLGDGVTLFKRPPPQAIAARAAAPVVPQLAAPMAPPAGLAAGVPQLALAAGRQIAGGVPAMAGLDYFAAAGAGGISSYESAAARSTRDALQIGGYEPRSGLVATMSNGGGGFTGGPTTVATSPGVSFAPVSTKLAPEWLRTAITRSGADNFVFKSIAQDAGQLAHWNRALRTVAANPESKYALSLAQPLTAANARAVFHEINSVFFENLGIAGAGTHNNHHWNSLAVHPELSLDPRNLYLVESGLDAQRHRIGEHIFLHWASREGNPWSGKVRPGGVQDLGWPRSVIEAMDTW